MSVLTDGVVPAVDSEQAAAGDRHSCRHTQVGQRVGSYVCHRRVGGKFQHHDHILLHLILKHEWTLRKETLMKKKNSKKDRDGHSQRGRGEQKERGGKEKEGRMKGKKRERGMLEWNHRDCRRNCKEGWKAPE